MSKLRVLLLGSALMLAMGLAGCPPGHSNQDTDGGSGGGGGGGAGGGGGGGAETDGGNDGGTDGGLEFTAFVRWLIDTQTLETSLPATTEDKVFIDSQDPAAFPASFFQ